MTTRKEALLKAGRIKAITRGRISGDNLAWIAEQEKSGVRFNDAAPAKRVNAPVKRNKGLAPAKEEESLIPEIHILYPKNMYKAVANDGTVYGMAEVCNNCRYSLVQCHCGHPTIYGDISVRIMPNE